MERETYNSSRQGLDTLNNTLQTKLDKEVVARLELERELKLQTNIRSETESAMKIMEMDLSEKDNMLSAAKKQLDDFKLINLEMYQKLQTAETALKSKVRHDWPMVFTRSLQYCFYIPSRRIWF